MHTTINLLRGSHGAEVKVSDCPQLFHCSYGTPYETNCLTSRNVDRPIARLSEAPMRVNTESKTCMLALAAGTKEPICMCKADYGAWELLNHKRHT